MKTQKKAKKFIHTSDYAVTMYQDLSTPMVLTLQLTHFSKEISEYLQDNVFFEASNGIRVVPMDGFTYTPMEEAPVKGYLSGFYSTKSTDCYSQAVILCKSEEEKLCLSDAINSTVNELIQAVFNSSVDSSLWIKWNLDEPTRENRE